MFKFCTYTFLTVITVDLLATAGDQTMTWTSPVLPQLYSEDPSINPMDRPITPDEESWIGSLINIGAIIGPLPFGFLSKKIGRKISLLCIAVPYIVSFALLAFLHNIYVYYFARILAGISGGAGCSLLPLYIAEIAEDSNRGMLSVTLNVFWTFGTLIPYILGPYMPIVWFNLTLACVPVVFFIFFIIIGPESPYYLVGRDDITGAEDSLMKLRSKSRNAVAREITSIQNALKQDQGGTFMDLVRTKSNLKALGISLILMAFQQLSGINAVLFYTQSIFEISGSDLPPEISSIIIGVVFFLTSFIIPFVADNLGRRIFLMISSSGMMLSLVTLGAYFYYKDILSVDVGSVHWLPILTLVLFICFFNLGYAAIPWTVSSELFSVNVKPIGASVVSMMCFLGSFIVTKFFNDMTFAFGRSGTFWVFAGFCFFATLFAWLFVPETRGKSFAEIKKILEE